MALAAAAAAAEKKGRDIVLLDMREVVVYTDYMVVCTGSTPRQTKAIADEVRKQLKERGFSARRVEGEPEAEWILMDYIDIVVHVFTPQSREFYRLERLWSEAPRETPELAAS